MKRTNFNWRRLSTYPKRDRNVASCPLFVVGFARGTFAQEREKGLSIAANYIFYTYEYYCTCIIETRYKVNTCAVRSGKETTRQLYTVSEDAGFSERNREL